MIKPIRTFGRRVLEQAGLIGIYYRWVESRVPVPADVEIDDGRPLPPGRLITLVGGGPGARWFSERGQADAALFGDLARLAGIDIFAGAAVLDFGCGSGRIARWLAPEVVAGGGRFFGTDINPKLVAWCAANLPGQYRRNALRPPAPIESGAVDCLYAQSVLTHLTEETAGAWLADFARVLRPGGCAIVTFHDEDYASAWAPAELQGRFPREGYVVHNNALEGSNYMSSWITRRHFTDMAAARFEIVELTPGRTDFPIQALAVLRARG